MPRFEQLFSVRDFLGINRRDGGEKASDREFLTIQNFYRKEKGVLFKRFGSTYDLTALQVPGAFRVTHAHRHPSYPAQKSVLYHCAPTSTPISHPGSTGLTVAEVVSGSGTIFAAAPAASRVVHLCYSYIGMGVESSWDTRTRALYVPYTGAPIDAWNQLGLQTFVLAASTNMLDVSHPTAFPSDVRAVNVFMSIGDPTDGANRRQLVYVGTLKSTADVLRINTSIAPLAAAADTYTFANIQAEGRINSGGDIPAGQYYISVAWVIDGEPGQGNLAGAFGNSRCTLSQSKVVTVSGTQNSIGVNFWEAGAVSPNGATHVYVFFGTKPKEEAPMVCVGSFRIGAAAMIPGFINALTILSVPYNMNASALTGANANFAHTPHQLDGVLGIRHGFIVKKDADRPVAVSEVFPSRSDWNDGAPTNTADFQYLLIRTSLDRVFNNTAAETCQDIRIPSLAFFNGASYLANGRDFLVTDGVAIARMSAKAGCVIPEKPLFIFSHKNQLVASVSENKAPIYGSNALQANNWSDGGTGLAFRFAILGDAFESKIVTASLFSYTTGTDGPRSFIVVFKKNSCWSLSNIPDATAGINAQADQLSGSVGTMAPRTIVQTKIGLMFLGSDGDMYMIRGSGEPLPIGSRIKELLKHLSENESLMEMCSAVRHGDFYKLAYPSSSTSTYADAQLWADLRTDDGNGIQWDGPHTGLAIGCQLVLDRDGDSGDRIAGLGNAAGVAKLDDESTYQDLGVNIQSILEWTRRRMRAEFNLKKFKGVFVEAFYDTTDAQALKIEGFSDAEYALIQKTLSPGNAISGEALWRREVCYFVDDNLIGSDFRFKITHEANTQFTISAVGVPYKPERRLAI